MRPNAGLFSVLLLAFGGGFLSHMLYQRWAAETPDPSTPLAVTQDQASLATESTSFRVNYMPLSATAVDPNTVELPPIVARDVEKIRSLVGQQARIRGRVFRVGHSVKSNTYFINFGPSREALTAVIFNSASELFEKNKQPLKQLENRDVEIIGFIKDHPQYGLELVLEHPKQIKILN